MRKFVQDELKLIKMNKLNLKIVAFSALFFWAGSLSAQTFLHTDGQNMVDESGKKVLLQGVGLGNWLLPEGYMWKFGEKGESACTPFGATVYQCLPSCG